MTKKSYGLSKFYLVVLSTSSTYYLNRYLRMDVKDKFPQALPKFLSNAVKWSCHKHVAEVHALLLAWPHVEPDEAIALLSPQFADEKVREFAVTCLDEKLQ